MKKELIVLAVATSFSAETYFHHKPDEHYHNEISHAENTMNALNVYGITGNTISQATTTVAVSMVINQS